MADILRNAIRSSGQSANAIARATGVTPPTICRFLSGKDMLLSRADKIAADLEIVFEPRRGKKPDHDKRY